MDRKEAVKLCRCGLSSTYIERMEKIAFCFTTAPAMAIIQSSSAM